MPKATVLCEYRNANQDQAALIYGKTPTTYEHDVHGAEGQMIEEGDLLLLDSNECVVARFHSDVWASVVFTRGKEEHQEAGDDG